LANKQPQWLARLRQQADGLYAGRCALLGLEDLDIGNPPRWHQDAASGQTAPLSHWSTIAYLDPKVAGDHKVLWEVNRHQYLLAPTMCWLIDRDPKRFALVQAHLSDWLMRNPPRVGVNWASSLEVAYRAIAWTWLQWLLRAAPWDPTLLARLATALRAHGRHVESYLSVHFSPNTHLTGEALGMCYIATVLPEAPESGRWWALGSGILETWLGRQVTPDGVYFEQSTQYQRYTAEIYLHYLLLARATGRPIAAGVAASLQRQFEVLRSLADARGYMPILGDDDGGLLLALDSRPPDDLAPLLQTGAALFERADLWIGGADSLASATWLCGPASAAAADGHVMVPAWTDRHFPEGGLITLRGGWGPQDSVAVLDAGPHGALNCGHAHADALALTLSLGNQPVFIDRGTYSYVGPERNQFRETMSHNTLEVDGESSVVPLQPFQWGPIPPRPRAHLWHRGPVTGVEAEAYGHAGTGRPSLHRRVVLRMVGGAWVVVDGGERPGSRAGVIRWQMAPNLIATEHQEGVFAISRSDGATVAWIVSCGVVARRVSQRTVSLRLRHQTDAQCIELDTGPKLRAATVIVPAAAGSAAPVFATDTAVQRVEWQDPSGRHRLLWPLSLGFRLAYKDWTARARLLCWTENPAPDDDRATQSSWLVAVDATDLRSPEGVTLVAGQAPERAITTVFHRSIDGWEPVPTEEVGRPQE
jgi:hypothetical protein